MANIIAVRPFKSRVTSMAPKNRAVFSIFAILGLARQRRQLAKLEAHLLADIGVTKDAAISEATRPIWDVPAHWTA